jgi:hypothetical protein
VEGGGVRFCFFAGGLPAPTVTANVIIDCSANGQGSALCCLDAEVVCQNLTLVGNVCTGGVGGAVAALSGSLTLRNCIIAENQGGGIYRATCDLVTDYCDVWGNQGGDYLNCLPSMTDIACDPAFCDAGGGDYHLYETSGCQGSGSNGVDIGALGVSCFTVPEVVFYDNFSDQNDIGWSVTNEGAAALVVDSGTYLGTVEVSGGRARSVVTADDEAFPDCSYWVAARPVNAWQPGVTLDVYFRFADPDHYYCVRLNGSGGELYKRNDGHLELLQEFAAAIAPDTWTRLRFTTVDRELTGATLNDGVQHPLFVHHDLNSPILTGTVGVGITSTGSPCEVRFDDVMIAELHDPVTAVPGTKAASSARASSVLGLRIYPVPFGPMVTIDFEVPRPQAVVMAIYTVDGRRIATLLDERRPAGRQRIFWHGRNVHGRPVPSGIYFFRLEADGQVETSRLVRAPQ